ncbi:MAG: peptide ABC transporter substrate-binding protein, partial [Deltaproteobacteria bacterium]|nr:peptide ABC transporter substrate-binding protein [Deltaproteobacteria bacterium]
LALSNEPDTLDSARTIDIAALFIIQNTMEGLVSLDPHLNPTPAAAESWSVSEDQRTFTFRLREDAKWSDGISLEAKHFVAAWRRAIAPETASQTAYLLYPIENAEKIQKGELPPQSLAVRALDERTLEVNLQYPSATFLKTLSQPISFPVRMDIIEKRGERWFEPPHAISNGPYTLSEWQHDYKAVLLANKFYSGKAPSIEKAEIFFVEDHATSLSLFESGKIDIASIPFDHWERVQKSPLVHRSSNLATTFMVFNLHRPPFDQVAVRKAFSLAIDSSLLSKVTRGRGLPIETILPLELTDPQGAVRLSYNPGKAKKSWEEAGHLSHSSPYLIGSNGGEDYKTVLEWLQHEWKEKLGVITSIETSEWKVYFQRLKNDNPYPIYRFGWQAAVADPTDFLALFQSDNPNNFSGWNNPRYDALVREVSHLPIGERRRRLVQEALKILLQEEVVALPLYNFTRHRLIQPWVKGYWANGQGPCPLRDLSLADDATH